VVVEDGKSLLAATHSGAIPTYELPGLTPLGLAAESQPGVTPHLGAIRLALDPDSRILAMGAFSGKKSVVLRDARTLTPLLLLKYQYIMVFNFGRSGANLAACGLERVVTLWNVALIRSELAPSGPEWVAPASASPRPPGPASDRGAIPSAETIEVPATPGVADKQWPALLRKAEAHLRRGRRAVADAGFEAALAVGQGDPSQYR
jgi:hypothetical protein